jgi:hypothetical protein
MSYRYWKDYFTANQTHFDQLDWNVADELSAEEKKCIYNSLQQFQKGENSEGKHLYSFAKTFPDPEYFESIKLFIKEEQKHAQVLAKFMELHSIPKIKSHWIDSVFRGLRKFFGLENTIIVLVTAEIIAKVYYRALFQASSSTLLKKICNQILQDEDQHLAFQATTLNHFYHSSPRWKQIITRSWHRILMTGTIFVVWLWHKKVLKSGGSFFSKFFMETMLVYFDVERNIKLSGQLTSQSVKA